MQGGNLTSYNKAVIITILIFFALNVVIIVDNILLWTVTQVSWFKNYDLLHLVLRVFMQPVSFTLIFLTCLGCLYLFHYQAMKMRAENISPTIRDLLVNYREDLQQDSEPLGEAETLRESTSGQETAFIKFLEDAT